MSISDRMKEYDETHAKYKEQDLKKIGFWYSDHEEEDKQYPHAEDFIDNSGAYINKMKGKVIDYLKHSGRYWGSQMGMSKCRICGKWDNGCSEYTDGKYLWPEGLLHYVEEHGIRIKELEEHIRGLNEKF